MREITIIADFPLQTTTIVRKLAPTAKLPTTATLRRLKPGQLERLQKVLSEPLECVHHPSFDAARCPGSIWSFLRSDLLSSPLKF